MIKISIIIPVYNCEAYLEQCLTSVQNQTMQEMEILCIDDGSADSSLSILEKYAREDSRITIHVQKNMGAGAARNVGLRKAKGKYVAFLDADDYYLDRNALEMMYDVCEAKGVAACGSLRKRLENGEIRCEKLFQETEKNTILHYRDFQLDYDYQSFLFLRKHLTDREIFFPSYRRFQDPPFLVRALYEAEEFTVADVTLYCYRAPDIMTRFNIQKTVDLLKGLIDNLLFAKEHGLEILFRNTVHRLEYEYEMVICGNARTGDQEVLKLLEKANQMILGEKGIKEQIRPLRVLSFNVTAYEKKLFGILEDLDEFVLYGAGAYGQVFLAFLKRYGFREKVKSFVVSDTKRNSRFVEDIPVCALQDEKRFIFVTASQAAQKEIENYLIEKGYVNYEPVRVEFLDLVSCEWE